MLIAPAHPGRVHVLEVVGNAIVGGMESCVMRLVERLPQERFAVTALCPFESRFTAGLRRRGADVVIAPMSDDPTWSSIQMTCSLIRAGAIDVLHAHLPNAHVLAGLAGKLTAKPVLATIHGRQPSTTDLEVQRCTGTHLSVVSRHSYFHALGLGVSPAQLSCIPNGVDTQTFLPGRHGAAGIRRQLGMADDAPLIGFVGRLSVEKGPEVFVRAALLLRSSLPSARLVLIGDGPMRGELEALIAALGLGQEVHLLGLREDMPAIYHDLDALVSCSHSEAMPLVVMEAMASGLPVVATRVGGVPEVVEQGETGWLIGPGEFQGVAWALGHIFLRPGEAARLGANARQRVVDRFSLLESTVQTERLLAQLAAAAPVEAPTLRSVSPGAPRRIANGAAAAKAAGEAAATVARDSA